MKRFLTVICAVTFCLVMLSCDKASTHRQVSFEDNQVILPLEGLIDRQPQFYSVSLEGKMINFFLIKVNGDIQSYLDACLSCYQKKQGFREIDGLIVCKSCGLKHAVEDLKTGVGGCYPIRLKGSVKGKQYAIRKDDLMQGLKYF